MSDQHSLQHNFKLRAALAAIALAAAVTFGAAAPSFAKAQPHATLRPFSSDEELLAFLKHAKRSPPPAPSPAPMPSMTDGAVATTAAPAQAAKEDRAGASDDNITNNQEAGVDEGDIVKARGDLLVILRRGRLFTVSTRRGDLRPIDYIDAFPPGVDPRADWYDEMLIAGNRVIVIGYSYGRGGTEINRFRLSADGRLAFEDAYHLRSNDYYSSRNYASRLIGTKLIVYSPLYLPYGIVDRLDWMPGLRRWSGNPQGGFTRIVSPRHIYIPQQWRDGDDLDIEALHTVTSCDLAAPVLNCDATSVLGPNGRTFYVSAEAVYVWVTQSQWAGDRNEQRGPRSLVYRLPLDGSAPSAVGVHGVPTDQFSFREDAGDGVLNVLVRSEGGGDAMWRPEFSAGAVSLLRLPLPSFGDGEDEADWSNYRGLPKPRGEGYSYAFQNRFVGDFVLYGNGASWGQPQDRMGGLVVASVRGRGVAQLSLAHGIDRIEAMGANAIVIGADAQDLHFQAVELTAGSKPMLGDDYVLRGANQGETRSHAFFFKGEASSSWWGDNGDGVLGFPVARAGRPGYQQLAENSAAMLFIRRSQRHFAPLGEIGSSEAGVVDDACQASCVDWYGNARPIFLRERTFALMGYELIESEIGARGVHETQRINFAPPDRRRGR